MSDTADYWNDHKEYERKQKRRSDNVFYDSHLPALARRAKRWGLVITSFNGNHFRVNKEGVKCFVDFWNTMTVKAVDGEYGSGWDYLVKEMFILSRKNNG